MGGKRWVSLLAGFVLLVPGTAHATVPATVPVNEKLIIVDGSQVAQGWSQQYEGYGDGFSGDSPLDPAKQEWFVGLAMEDPYDYAYLYSNGTGVEGLGVDKVRNLSFDWSFGDGFILSPRFQVDFTNGGFAYLSGVTCLKYIGSNGPQYSQRWYRSDFTGQKAVSGATCGLWMHSYTGVWDFYTASKTHTAWQALAAAKPRLIVSSVKWWFMGDEVNDGENEYPPGYGPNGEIYSSQLDRLAIENLMWSGPNTVKKCPKEASC